ncbi:hypothetical protein ACHAWF_008071 [Thalassiosira exigua]
MVMVTPRRRCTLQPRDIGTTQMSEVNERCKMGCVVLALLGYFSSPSPACAFHQVPISAAAVAARPLTRLHVTRSGDKEVELAKLADGLNVSPAKVRELLIGQRRRLGGSEAKAKHIDWLLDVDQIQNRAKKVKVKAKTTAYDDKGEASSSPRKYGRKVGVELKPAKKEVAKPPRSSRKKVDARDSDLLTNVDFSDRTDLHPASKRALAEMSLERMTEIQARTYDAALSGRDVLGRARTGTGKTIAYLLPAIERLLRSERYIVGENVGILVISPTRELANQIGDEAEKLVKHHRELSVQVAFGGTKVARDISKLKNRRPSILVATPGRLLDLLQTAVIGGTRFCKIMSSTPLVVLDETDQLLDMGFRREIQKILSHLPRNKDRQTLLFSATIPKELKAIMAETMSSDYIEVDCIRDGDDGEASTQTHAHIKQSHAIIASMDQYVPSVIRVVKEAAKAEGGHKIVVFFPTARMVSFFADLFNLVVDLPVLEIHSKKSQSYRNRVSEQFRSATSAILLTSDVSARGVDYPGVTHVIQFGMPSSREQYVHRLGRTGRAGAEGKGWLVLNSFESLFLEELKNISVPKDLALVELLNRTELDGTDDLMLTLLNRVQSRDKDLVKSGEGAYQAFLGYYLGQMKRVRMKRKEQLVEIAKDFSGGMGFRSPPTLTTNMISKMGLKGVVGLKSSSKEKGKTDQRKRLSNHHNKNRGEKPKRKGKIAR